MEKKQRDQAKDLKNLKELLKSQNISEAITLLDDSNLWLFSYSD